MSAARSPRHRAPEFERAAAPADIAELRARRRGARRRRRLARVDVGLGVGCGLVLLIASPGLAVTGLIAGLVLLVCLISIVIGRRRAGSARRPAVRRPR
jgi:hypothetical protein